MTRSFDIENALEAEVDLFRNIDEVSFLQQHSTVLQLNLVSVKAELKNLCVSRMLGFTLKSMLRCKGRPPEKALDITWSCNIIHKLT